MRLRCSLALWGFWHGVLALILPQYDAQGPMLLELAQTREPAFDYVILAFTKVDDPKTYRAEVPLGVRIPSGVSLPMHASTLKIETAVNKYGRARQLADLDHIVCRAVPMPNSKEKAEWDISGVEKVWPWFSVRDGTVSLSDSSSRWFLAGQIASYECW